MSYINGGNSDVKLDVVNDGTFRAKVQVIPEAGVVARKNIPETFAIAIQATNAADANDNAQFILQNKEENKKIVITGINVSVSVAGILSIASGHTWTSGGTAAVATNTNLSSTADIDYTSQYRGTALVLAGTAGTAAYLAKKKLLANTDVYFEFKDALILPYNKSITLYYKGAGSETLEITVLFYMEGV